MTQSIKSYQSKRRKRGAQPGNLNAEGVQKHIDMVVPNEACEVEFAEANGLEKEILMLRAAIWDLDRIRKQAQTLQELLKTTQMMSLAGERLGKLLLVHKKLGGETSYLQRILNEAIDEVMEEMTGKSEGQQ